VEHRLTPIGAGHLMGRRGLRRARPTMGKRAHMNSTIGKGPGKNRRARSPSSRRITSSTSGDRIEGGIMPVNSFVIHGPDGLVVVDGMLTVSDAALVRQAIDDAGRSLAGVVITHPHPDHYAGLWHLIGNNESRSWPPEGWTRSSAETTAPRTTSSGR
jgi:glyoxylase-like metal-dependent hydrolase (beta-lactamase superfamily II)